MKTILGSGQDSVISEEMVLNAGKHSFGALTFTRDGHIVARDDVSIEIDSVANEKDSKTMFWYEFAVSSNDGKDGADGQDGESAGKALSLQIKIRDLKNNITIATYAGSGGSGGSGGNGRDGGNGGNDNGSGGSGGDGGDGGNGGNGANGNNIDVSYSTANDSVVSLKDDYSPGGLGGAGGSGGRGGNGGIGGISRDSKTHGANGLNGKNGTNGSNGKNGKPGIVSIVKQPAHNFKEDDTND